MEKILKQGVDTTLKQTVDVTLKLGGGPTKDNKKVHHTRHKGSVHFTSDVPFLFWKLVFQNCSTMTQNFTFLLAEIVII